MFRLKSIKLTYFSIILGVINLLFYNIPFFRYVLDNVNAGTFNGVLLIASLLICAVIANAMVFYLFIYLFKNLGRWIVAVTFIINSIALYFINTYHVIIDQSMMGNVFNTNYEESSSYFSFKMVLYLIFLGILPAFYIIKQDVYKVKFKKFISVISITIIFLLSISYVNAPNWLWIDKNSKTLGALVMPWSYLVNTGIYYKNQYHKNQKQILLPDAEITDDSKALVVLVIGESARKENFSLYGYNRNTNPRLAEEKDLKIYNAESYATYTTAGVKAMLEHKDTGSLYEILPNYLYRNNVDVIWRTTNWGEPNVNIDQYLRAEDLRPDCSGEDCDYDGVLLSNLSSQIKNSHKNKILIVLHTSTSHGPTYYKKYPERFNQFTPVCQSVELAKCTQEELINAYDNTIVYTDYILSTLIENLKEIKDYKTTMLFVSDHGESLGEKNLYMHGLPMSIAPKEQYEIPFIMWTSDDSIKFKPEDLVGQHHVFHTILDLLSVKSPVYTKEMSLIEK